MRPRRILKALLAFVVIPIVVGAAVVLILANTPWGNDRIRGLIVSQGNKRITGKLAIGSLRGNLFSNATLTDVDVSDSLSRPIFKARRVRVEYALWPALRGKVVIKSVVLDTPFVNLDKQPGQRWNFQITRPSTSAKDTTRRSIPPELNDITIHHGRFLYRRPWKPDSTLSGSQQDSAIASALRTTARRRTESVPGGFQRVLDYHDLDAHLAAVHLATGSTPLAVEIAQLAMLAEPYRPPAIDVRSLVGTLYGNKDSLWWHGAKMLLPASNVSGDGKIGFRKSGFRLDLTGAPVAVADLRWLNPTLGESGGGNVRYVMNFHADTQEFAISNADLKYGTASLIGHGAIARVKPKGKKTETIVRDADLTVARLSTAVIHELAPSVTLKRAGILDGHIIASGPLTALHVNADVTFDDARSGRSRVTALGGLGIVDGVTLRELSVHALPLQVATLSAFGVKTKLGGVINGEAVVSGTKNVGWSVRGDVTHLESGERSRVTGSGRYQTSGKRIIADATLMPLSLATVGRFVPSAELRGSVTGEVHATGTTNNLRVSGNLRSSSGGSVNVKGTVAPDGSRSRYDIAAVLDALNANALSKRAPSTLLNGTVSARGQGFKLETANSVFAVDLARSRYDTFSVERAYTRGHLADGLLNLDTLSVIDRGILATAKGSLGLITTQRGTMLVAARIDSMAALQRFLGAPDTGVIQPAGERVRAALLRARADSARRAEAVRIEQLALGLPLGVALLVDSIPPVRRDSLAGSLAAAGTLRGNVKELGVDATIAGSGLVVRGYSARQLHGNISSANVMERAVPLTFGVAAESLQAAGQAFESVSANGVWANKRVAGAFRLRDDSLVSYAAVGSYSNPAKGAHDVSLDSLRAQFGTVGWRLAHAASVHVTPGNLAIDSLDLRSNEGGRLYANGTLPKVGAIHLDVAADQVRVSTVLRALQRDTPAEGFLAATATIEGTRAAPAVSGRATLREAYYNDFRVPDVDTRLGYLGRQLTLAATARDSVGRQVLVGNAALPIDLSFAGEHKDRLIEGPIVADLTLDSLAIGTLSIHSTSIETVSGTLAGDAHARGSWKVPAYSGHLALRDGALSLPLATTGMKVDRGVADVHFNGDSIIVDSLTAWAKNRFRAYGSVDIRDRKHPFVNLAAGGNDLRVFDSPRGLVDADVSVVAIGPLDSVRVTGRGEMHGGFLALKQFRKDLLRVKSPGDLSFFMVYDTSATVRDSTRAARARTVPRKVAVIADLSLVVDRGNYYRNRPDGNLEFYTGDNEVVHAHIDQRSTDSWAVGFVRIGDGNTYFRTQAFLPARGALTFTPHTSAAAMVQQVGERIIWEPGRGLFPLQLLTGGTSTGPAVGLEGGSLFPMRGRELNGYLTMGRLSTSLLQQSGSSLSGSSWSGQLNGESGALAHRQQGATALGVVLHDIGTGATKEYRLDAFSVSPADVPTELVYGKSGGVRGALIEGGRYITTDLFVAAQLRFTRGIPGIRMEKKFGSIYRLNVGLEPRLLFTKPEELGITHPTTRTGVFGAFLTRLWDF